MHQLYFKVKKIDKIFTIIDWSLTLVPLCITPLFLHDLVPLYLHDEFVLDP